VLRAVLGARRRTVSTAVAEAAGRMVAAQILTAPEIEAAVCVGLYASLPDEVSTRVCFESLRRLGCECLFPRMAEGGRMVFARVGAWDQLAPGRFGVLEPPAREAAVVPGAGDLVLVPGVAFDLRGHRLGRGAGSYDAAFPPGAAEPPLLFGVAYEFQVLESLPYGSRDRRMDAIVTERTIRRVQGA
jgi:5-formyltetrahydrofolate cyclo-ligase